MKEVLMVRRADTGGEKASKTDGGDGVMAAQGRT